MSWFRSWLSGFMNRCVSRRSRKSDESIKVYWWVECSRMRQVMSRCVNRRSWVMIQTGTRMRVRVRMLGSWVDECVWGVDWGVDGSSGRNWLRSGIGNLRSGMRSWWVLEESIQESNGYTDDSMHVSLCQWSKLIEVRMCGLMSWFMLRMSWLMRACVGRTSRLMMRVAHSWVDSGVEWVDSWIDVSVDGLVSRMSQLRYTDELSAVEWVK